MKIDETLVKQFERRLKGYHKFTRPLFYLWIKGELNSSEFLFFVLLASLCQFTKENPLYGVVDFTPSELAELIDREYETVHNWLKSLEKRGLIIITKRKRIKVMYYEELFQTSFFVKDNPNQKQTILSLFQDKLKNNSDLTTISDCSNNLINSTNVSSSKGNESSLTSVDVDWIQKNIKEDKNNPS